uniref:C2H2-type domain-containing protein n=1 Tax=Anopheles atroparvus TaxID=41427 RepID=A0AAG5DA07_ANOAO
MTEIMESESNAEHGGQSKEEMCSVCLAKSKCMSIGDPRFRQRNVSSYIARHLDLELELKTICHRCWSMLDEFHEFYEMINKQYRIQQSVTTGELQIKTDTALRGPETEPEFVEIKDEPLEPIKEEELLYDSFPADTIAATAADGINVDGVLDACGSVALKEESDAKCTRKLRSKQIHSLQPSANIEMKPPTESCEVNDKRTPLKDPKIDHDILEFYKRLVCEVCDPQKMQTCEPSIEYSNLKDLNRHMRKAHKQEKGNINCPMCDKKFRSRAKLLEHKDMHLNPERFRCNQCNEVHQNLEEHIKNKHQERIYCCEDCEKRFPTKSRLTAHIRKMHTAKDVICDQCQKPFSKYTIKDHKRAVHESNFMCEHCPRIFKSRLPLEQHLEEHKTGARPAPTATCNICGTVVRDKYCLATHMKRLHTKHAPVNCGSCGKEFKSKHNLDAHLANVCTDRSFPCTICGKQFKKKLKLKEHMTTHTKSALYQCPFCPKTFSFETQFYTHRKQVHYEQWLELQRRRKEGERFKATRIGD